MKEEEHRHGLSNRACYQQDGTFPATNGCHTRYLKEDQPILVGAKQVGEWA